MGKSIPFNLLTIREQRRYKNSGFTQKLNTGLDTETYKGYVKLICDDLGHYKEVDDFEQIIHFLTKERFRNNFNWFYNIQFDFESIIKYLDKDDLLELYSTKKLQHGFYSLYYIPKKFFSIKLKNNSRFYFYDMYGFLETSLSQASKNYLKEDKLSNIVDSSRLNTDLKYWKENRENIIKYCIKDAELTKRLADYFWNLVYKNMDYYPKRPFSKGKIAEEYFLAKCYIPTINEIPLKVLEFAYNSYLGGRFELLQKGYFEQVYTYDIKSAYPSIIAEQIDYSQGVWKKFKNKINPDCHTGYYLCSVDCLEILFSPFTKKISGLSVYPNGKFKQYLTKNEIEFYKDNFESVDIKIIDGVEFFPEEILHPFRNEINKLYAWKEKEKDKDIKYAVKIFMNAFYGKTIQKSGDENLTGKVFNPLWASNITSETRLKLFQLMLQNPDAIIGTSTDSVHSQEPLRVPKHPKLGDFDLDFQGEGVYIMSDVYYLWNTKTGKSKDKIRGFSLSKTKDTEDIKLPLTTILKNMKKSTIYEYYTERPFHLGECLTHTKKRKIMDLNIFSKVKKSIKINGDKKRVWERDFKNGQDCLKNSIKSMPLLIK